MPDHSEHDIWGHLKQRELLKIVDEHGLEVRDRRYKQELIDALDALEPASRREALLGLSRERLTTLCADCGLKGRAGSKDELVECLFPAPMDPCPACDGTLEEECHWCDEGTQTCWGECAGTGRVECSDCSGTGRVYCSSCGGSGDRWCYDCNGSGNASQWSSSWDDDDSSWPERCSTCGGSGRLSCSSCGGSGDETCGACVGCGEVDCSRCDGRGEQSCVACGGCGRSPCSQCGGSGERQGGFDVPTQEKAISLESDQGLAELNDELDTGSEVCETRPLAGGATLVVLAATTDVEEGDVGEGRGRKALVSTREPDLEELNKHFARAWLVHQTWPMSGGETLLILDGANVEDCSWCEGSGKRTCYGCDGSGERDCHYCDARGTEKCRECRGTGVQTCGACHGSGVKKKFFGKQVACPSCGGSKQVTCGHCHGHKGFQCSHCGGSRKIECDICGGTTLADCSHCDGTGERKV